MVTAALLLSSLWVCSAPAEAAPSTCTTSYTAWTWHYGTTKSHLASANVCIRTSYAGRSYWLIFSSNGLLAYYESGVRLWGSGTAGRGHKLVLRGNGDMEIRNTAGTVLWSTDVHSHVPWRTSTALFGVGFTTTNAHPQEFRRWTEDEGPGGCECGETLWQS